MRFTFHYLNMWYELSIHAALIALVYMNIYTDYMIRMNKNNQLFTKNGLSQCTSNKQAHNIDVKDALMYHANK